MLTFGSIDKIKSNQITFIVTYNLFSEFFSIVLQS